MRTGTVTAGTELAWERAIDDAPVALGVGGGQVAVAGADGEVSVYDGATGSGTGRFALPGGALHVAIAPDGAHAAATGPTGYALWRRGADRAAVTETGEWCSVARWADDRRVAVAAARRAVVLDPAGERLWGTEPAASTVTDLAWMRGGRRLAVAAYGAVRCHERHRSAPVATYSYLGSHLALAVAPTDRWICSGNQDASIHIWRTRDGEELTMAGYPEKVSRLAFDDTGTWLAADGAADLTVWSFAGKGPAGTAPRSLRCHDAVTAIAWRPGSGGHLASGGIDGTLALWHATAGRPQAVLRPRRALSDTVPIAAVAWVSPHLLVAAYRDGRVRCHRLSTRATT